MSARTLLRRVVVVLAVALSGTTLTACHDLYCAFVEGLTGQPVDCSHEPFPDLPDVPVPSLPPPPSLPTTTTTQPEPATPTSTTTSSTTTTTSANVTTTTVAGTTATPGSAAAEIVAERLRRLERIPAPADATELAQEVSGVDP